MGGMFGVHFAYCCLPHAAARCRIGIGIEKRCDLQNCMSSSAPQDTTNLLKFEVM